jgi:hypothetical protein
MVVREILALYVRVRILARQQPLLGTGPDEVWLKKLKLVPNQEFYFWLGIFVAQ